MASVLRAGVVGTGFVGVVHVHALRLLGVEVAGVVGSSPERASAKAIAPVYDSLEARIVELQESEDLARVRPDLDGNAIMGILGIGPGPEVGQAWRFLKELRMERGPLEPDEAEAELRAWWARRNDT